MGTALSLLELRLHLYSLRREGASHDLLRRRRSAEQVFRRGRWAVTSSMKRYAKEAALLNEMHKVRPEIFQFGHTVEQNFQHLLEHGFDHRQLTCLATRATLTMIGATPPSGRRGGTKRRRAPPAK